MKDKQREAAILADIGHMPRLEIIRKHRIGRDTLNMLIAGMGDDYVSYSAKIGTKITAHDALLIRELDKGGLSRFLIADKFDITAHAVGEIIRRERWANAEKVVANGKD